MTLDKYNNIAPLFAALKGWLSADAAHGCMFFNALGEYKSRSRAIEAVILDHKAEVRATVDLYLRTVLDGDPGRLTDQIVLLIEGVTAQSAISNTETAVAQGQSAARCLLEAARKGESHEC